MLATLAPPGEAARKTTYPVHVSAEPELETRTVSLYVPSATVTQSPPCRESFVAAPRVWRASAIDVPLFVSLPVGDTKYSAVQV